MAIHKINVVDHAFHQPRHEIILVAETVAREKGIEPSEVIDAMEHAIQKSAKSKYGFDKDIRATIDRKTGEILLNKMMTVVEVIENPAVEVSLADAKLHVEQVEIGDILEEQLPPIDFGRVAAQSARQVIVQKVRDAERAHQFEEYKDRTGQIANGVVKRVEFGNVVLDLGRSEGILRRDDLIQREVFRSGDRVRAIISDVRPDARGPMVALSRTSPTFLAKLFEQEVPEIYDNVIEVKSVSRDPGSRAKMAVYTHDASIDPVGACVGLRGARVQSVVTELQGEKIDIIPWSSDPATFVVNALAPAEVIKVVLDEENRRVDVVVAEDQLSLAIGRRGQNVRLASQLTGWNIDIITESDDQARRAAEYSKRTNIFMDALDVDEVIAQLLAAEGFSSVVELTFTPVEDLINIEGFDESVAAEIQNRAIAYIERTAKESFDKVSELGMSEDILDIDGVTVDMLGLLSEAGVKTLDDFADLAGDELLEIIKNEEVTLEQANEMIMAARAHWFADEEGDTSSGE